MILIIIIVAIFETETYQWHEHFSYIIAYIMLNVFPENNGRQLK